MSVVPASLVSDWVALASISGFAAMGIDKLLAVGRKSRVSEKTLWVTALLGGFPGILVGGFVFRHKTSKTEFWWPVIAAAITWVVAFALLTEQLGRISV